MRERPNIVLITVDQLRKDSAGCYGKWHVSQDATPLDFGFDHYTSCLPK